MISNPHEANIRAGGRIAVLDGYRALAILLVLVLHYTIRWAPPWDPSGHLAAGAMFDHVVPVAFRDIGVELFFVVSGFVILMTLERCRSVSDFAIRRVARLWPPLILAATLTTIVMALIGPKDWLVGKYDYLTSIIILHPDIMEKILHVQDIKWVDGAYWSLFVEIRFYFLAGIVYLLVNRKFVKYWVIFQIMAFGLTLVINTFYRESSMRALDMLLFPKYMPYFTLGLCIFEIYSNGALRRMAFTGAFIAAGMILFNAATGILADPTTMPTGYLLAVIANLVIVVLFYLFAIDHPAVSIFATRPMVLLGQASYSLYLIHQHIGVAIMRVAIAHGVPYLLILPITVVFIIGLAIALFHFWEEPAKRWMLVHSKRLAAALDRRMPWLSYSRT